ncbi:hypothetical protein HPB50_014241 [Hyalomma asiaticum]|uniref:Uncharacterized protein n=1 Tax=Hyalomma asiaticum TaxID=266040 RepID=A0ACB7RLB7_HYAAI|nr:hypothetical protein HPB50_014241 [Hyalomma asiaticum]
MEATPSPSFQCGLCQTNDHDITSPLCPTKRAATKKARRRRDGRSAKPSLQEASNEVATSNRYALLASMDEDTALPTNVPPKQGTPSYSAAAKPLTRNLGLRNRYYRMTHLTHLARKQTLIFAWLISRWKFSV